MSDESYDTVVIFERAITIDDGPRDEGGNGICNIYGLLYNRKVLHVFNPEEFIKAILMKTGYLMGCERLQQRGGDMSKTEWYLPSGRVIKLTYEVKEFIYNASL